MLRPINSPKSRVKLAAATINQERELSSLMSYYPALERLLSKFAESVPDTAQFAVVLRSGMNRISKHRRLVPLKDDCVRLMDFIESFVAAAVRSVLYSIQLCRESLPEIGEEGLWESQSPAAILERRSIIRQYLGLNNIEFDSCHVSG